MYMEEKYEYLKKIMKYDFRKESKVINKYL